MCLSCRDASEAIKQLRKPILLASQSHEFVMIILAMGLISIIIMIISVRTSGSSTQASPSSSTSASSSQTRGGPLPAGNLPPSLPPSNRSLCGSSTRSSSVHHRFAIYSLHRKPQNPSAEYDVQGRLLQQRGYINRSTKIYGYTLTCGALSAYLSLGPRPSDI